MSGENNPGQNPPARPATPPRPVRAGVPVSPRSPASPTELPVLTPRSPLPTNAAPIATAPPSVAPRQRPAAPTSTTSNVSIYEQIPQGLSLAEPGLSGIPALRPPARPTYDVAAELRNGAIAFRQTILPTCLVLGLTLPLLAAGWFALDRFSVVRDNPFGVALPITLGVVGVVFLAATSLLYLQVRRPPTAPTKSN